MKVRAHLDRHLLKKHRDKVTTPSRAKDIAFLQRVRAKVDLKKIKVIPRQLVQDIFEIDDPVMCSKVVQLLALADAELEMKERRAPRNLYPNVNYRPILNLVLMISR